MTHRVGVNLLWLLPGVVGGTEEAVCGYLSEVARERPPDLDITLYVGPDFAKVHPDVAASYRLRVMPASGRSRPARVLAESTWLRYWTRHDHIDVIHHYGGVVPPLSMSPSVLTVHDVQPLVHPDHFSPVKRRWLATMIPRSARAADVVVVPSRAVRDLLVEYTGISPDKVRVIWHGVTLPELELATADDRLAVRSAYRLAGPFVLYPAITYPHKNHLVLIEAFARVVADRDDVTLVLAGGVGSEEPAVSAAIERLGLGDRVRRVGRVPRVDLDALQLEASVLAFPSRFEGFGLPLLEAMAVGCPVVAARVSAIPEIVGEAALLVDPDDVAGFAKAIESVLDDSPTRAAMIDQGRARALRFAWREVADDVIDTYRSVLTA